MNFKDGQLDTLILPTREQLGEKAATDIEARIISLLDFKPEIRMIFAAAPSQDEMLRHLVNSQKIEWNRIIAFHMDEYIGLPANASQLFANYLRRNLFDLVAFKEVNFIHSENDPETECLRYGKLLEQETIDIVCLGIGENGHLAFNDPPVADFNDKKVVKIVELDEVCRQQQVNDLCFDRIEEVPKFAITLTIPTLIKASYLYCVVPGQSKQKAVYDTVHAPINTHCPASILRTHGNCTLYLDKDSSALLKEKPWN